MKGGDNIVKRMINKNKDEEKVVEEKKNAFLTFNFCGNESAEFPKKVKKHPRNLFSFYSDKHCLQEICHSEKNFSFYPQRKRH
jgi:hypothetical protein